MSTEPLIEQLQGLHLRGMAAALEQQKQLELHDGVDALEDKGSDFLGDPRIGQCSSSRPALKMRSTFPRAARSAIAAGQRRVPQHGCRVDVVHGAGCRPSDLRPVRHRNRSGHRNSR